METSIRAIARNISAAALMATLAAGVILCAPATSSAATTPASTTRLQSSTTAASASTTTTTASAPINGARQLSSVATELRSMPSLASLRDAAGATRASPQSAASSENDHLSTFDGKNPFADDSLWQIPIHLVRDLSASTPTGGRESMAKSASELSSAANSHDDNDEDGDVLDDDSTASLLEHQQAHSQQQPQPSGASNSPTVISASTDLKTAAGYHHASPHYGHGHHDAGHGHYGGGHHGGDHYGKYFQYASVPYPYAWDFGYRRGNPYHTIERYEHGKGPHFQTKVKWSDKYGGHGVHVWDYNHDDHHSHHYGGGGGDDHYGHDSHAPAHYGGHHAGAHSGHHYGGAHHH